jgi:hypothetical protein
MASVTKPLGFRSALPLVGNAHTWHTCIHLGLSLGRQNNQGEWHTRFLLTKVSYFLFNFLRSRQLDRDPWHLATDWNLLSWAVDYSTPLPNIILTWMVEFHQNFSVKLGFSPSFPWIDTSFVYTRMTGGPRLDTCSTCIWVLCVECGLWRTGGAEGCRRQWAWNGLCNI